MSLLADKFPDYAARLNAALATYEGVLGEVAAVPAGTGAPMGLDQRVHDAAGRLDRVGKDAINEVDECPGG